MGRLSVSQFAAACGLSPTAVRRYADAGILPSAVVDARTGYRWYDTGQVQAGVLVRVLRELEVPLATVRQVLALGDPSRQLAVVEQHWADVERSVEAGRAARDHVARVLGGWQQLLEPFEVVVRPVAELPVLLRRRRGSLRDLPALLGRSVDRLRARASSEGWEVAGAVVSLYAWLPEVGAGEHERIVDVALPVRRPVRELDDADAGAHDDADAVLPSGELLCTDAVGPDAQYPAVLAAYGAVSQWAHQRGQRLLDPPLMVHLGPERVRVGWRLEPGSTPTARPSGEGPA